jgi:predicted RecB family nuclease
MIFRDGQLVPSATDLASFLACRHRTALEIAVALGTLTRPSVDDPKLEALFARGLDHEANYVARLAAGGASKLIALADVKDRQAAIDQTIAAMRAGVDVIVQAALGDAQWYGRPDVLKKVTGESALGPWSYEVVDTKLARETKAGTILQLALYCTLLESAQGARPEHFHVVTPDQELKYRLDDYAAYFRFVQSGLAAALAKGDAVLADENYPEPVDHCDICVWIGRCAARRRKDDHLSYVAGIARSHRREFEGHDVKTLTALSGIPIDPLPFIPKRGAKESYVRVREQARVQVEARTRANVFELLDIVEEQGLCRLPEPSAGDIFLDLEGDPFAGPMSGPPMLRGREYLFGFVTIEAGEPRYQAFWAKSAAEERQAFETVVDLIMQARQTDPGMHVYHYAPYEPSAFKRLMGRYATREQQIDALLRAETFVDLYAVVRQGLRAGVERYSIKNMEPFYGFAREVELKDARLNLQAMELALEQGSVADLKPEVLAAVEGYNRDDCVSTFHLRNWLEARRADAIAGGANIPRPEQKSGDASEPLSDRQAQIATLRGQLLGGEGRDRYLLAYLLDWHRREEKAEWWDYFRLLQLTDEDLIEERRAVSGLEYVCDVGHVKTKTIQRYRFPLQEIELRRKDELKLKDQKKWGDVVAIDRAGRTIDVLVGPSRAHLRPSAAFAHTHISSKAMEDALFALGEDVIKGGGDPVALELLNRRYPKARRVTELRDTVLAIQGPPGSGKTYTGGKMICDLVAAGKTVGITATGHKVIKNLMEAAAKEAAARGLPIRLARKIGKDDVAEDEDGDVSVTEVKENDEARALLSGGHADVLGGTAWMWSRSEFRKSVDVLFIDEAGQMSLANALAMTHAGHALVLLGDPQQLEQPKKGSHPDGVGASVLEHILGDKQTMPAEQGEFLAETWRFGPSICDFTSEAFYEGKLKPRAGEGLECQALSIDGEKRSGLFFVDVEHDGNRSASDEEVEIVAQLVERLTAPGSMWIDRRGAPHQLTRDDILIVSPYNAQVARIEDRVPGVAAGTVDKFQGKEAPVVIYSMATSRPEDAPRGLEFLYSLNRLNVATSRAQCAAIIVASPRIFEPDCRTPRQMQLANALCRFREMASRFEL